MTRQALQHERFLRELRVQLSRHISAKEIDLAVFGEPHAGGEGWVHAVAKDGREIGVGKFLALCQFLAPESAARFRALCGAAVPKVVNPLASPVELIAEATQALMVLLVLMRTVDSIQSLRYVEADESLYRSSLPHLERARAALENLSEVIDGRLRAALDGERKKRPSRTSGQGSPGSPGSPRSTGSAVRRATV